MLKINYKVDFLSEFITLINTQNELIEFIQTHSFDGVWIWDINNPEQLMVDKLFLSSIACDSLFPESSAKGLRKNNLAHKGVEELSDKLHRISTDSSFDSTYFSIKTESETDDFLEAHFYPVKNKEGKIIKIFGGFLKAGAKLNDENKVLQNEVEELRKQIKADKFLFNQILDNLPINIYIKDTELKKTLANQSEITFCGASSIDEVLGKTDAELYGGLTAKDSLEEDNKVIQEKNLQVHKEVQFFKKDGSEAWIFSTKIPLVDEDGLVTGILGSSIDITEKKKIEKEIYFQSQLINRIGDSVIAIDKNELIIFWNKAAEETFGWKKEEVINKNIFELSSIIRLPVYDHKLINVPYDKNSMDGLFSVATKSSQLLIIKIKTTPIIDVNGVAIGVIGIGSNETDWYNTQKQLIKTQGFLLRAQEIAKLGAWEVDFSANTVGWSSVTKEIHNVPETFVPTLEEAIGFYKEGEHRNRVSTIIAEAINEGKYFNFESIIISTDGKEKWVKANGKPIMANGKCISLYGSFQDITEQKKHQTEIEKKQLLLETLSSQVRGILFQFKLDVEGHFSWPYISERAKDVYGFSPEDYYQNPNILVENTDPSYIQPLLENIQISAQQLTPFVFESKTFTKSGTEKWILTESIPQKQQDGSIIWSGYSQDITQRKLAEMELDATKNKLENILNSISEVVWSFEPMTRKLLFITPSVEMLYGVSVQDMESDNEIWKTTILDEDYQIMLNHYQTLEEKGEFTSEYRIKHAKTGQIKWTLHTGKYIYNELGKTTRIDGITKDITEKKLKEIALQKSEAKFRSYIENAPNAIFTHDVEGNINYNFYNSQVEKLSHLGNPQQRKNIKEVIHPDDLHIALPPLQNLIKNKISVTSEPFRIEISKGKWEWRVINGAPLLDENGEITEILAISTNVTSLMEKEEALIKEKAKANKLAAHYKSLLDNESVYVVKIDTKGYYTYVNEGFKKSFGIDDSIIGTYSLKIIVPEDWAACKEAVAKCMQQPEVYHKVVLRKPTSMGEIKIGTWEFVGKVDEQGQVEEILCIGYDITELNKLLEDTRELLRITADQNNRLQNFTYIISHNIRSHSANLQGVLRLMEETDDQEEKKVLFEMLKLSTERLNDTIMNLNDIIAIKREINTSKENKFLYNEIYKTLDILLESINESKAKIHIDVPVEVSVNVIPAYLDSIILNIMSNAIKYRSAERVCEITITVQKQDEYIVVLFKDNGVGMDMRLVKDKIFGMYKTFHSNSDAKGLGLFLTKNQVEAMNGKIEVESKVNVGSVFKVYFYDGV